MVKPPQSNGEANITLLGISYCTAVMNRTHHLKVTLPKNCAAQRGLRGIEFVVANYGSQDDLDAWLDAFRERHNDVNIRAVRDPSPAFFQSAPAKNLAHFGAVGDILCNLDADNFLGDGFSEHLRNIFRKEPDSIVRLRKTSASGRIALLRHHFLELNGYSTNFRGWGRCDDDLMLRACASRHLTLHWIADRAFSQFIDHDDEERTRHFSPQAREAGKWGTWRANKELMKFQTPDWIRGMLVPRGLHMVVLEGETEAGWRGNWESWMDWHPGWDARVWTEVEARTAVGNPPEGLSAERRRAWLANALLFEHGGVMVHPRVEALGPVEPAVRDVSSAVLPGAGDVLFHVTAAYRKHSLFWDIGRQPALLQRRALVPAFRRFAARHHWRDLAETLEADRPWRITKASRSQRSPA